VIGRSPLSTEFALGAHQAVDDRLRGIVFVGREVRLPAVLAGGLLATQRRRPVALVEAA
jgi:hypothetical protein